MPVHFVAQEGKSRIPKGVSTMVYNNDDKQLMGSCREQRLESLKVKLLRIVRNTLNA